MTEGEPADPRCARRASAGTAKRLDQLIEDRLYLNVAFMKDTLLFLPGIPPSFPRASPPG
jgi:hypothetical protein